MKVIHIALKDLVQSLRNGFSTIFMFGVPLLVTGMFYLMFGNIAKNEGGFNLPVTKVVIVNQDTGSSNLQTGTSMLGQPGAKSTDNLGEIIVSTLSSESLSKMLEVVTDTDAAASRKAVDGNKADIAIIIPSDFSDRFSSVSGQSQAVLELYANPEKSLQLAIVQSILEQFMDGMSGAKIAASVTAKHTSAADLALIGKVIQKYLADVVQQRESPQSFVAIKSVAKVEPPNRMLAIISPIMAGLMIFYAFYTGVTTAETILREDEEGTLARMFATPTSHNTILTGKFLAVGLTVFIQMTVLIIISRLVFQIQWGNPLDVTLMTLGTVFAASAFGIFTNSLIKSRRQGGIIYTGVMTVTGMLGMIKVFTASVPNAPQSIETASLLVPQGWAIRGFLQNSSAALYSDVLLTFAILLIWGTVFFAIGALRLHRRFA